MMTLQHWCAFIPGIWELIRIARLPGGGESRDIWKLGPVCIKRWSPRVSPADVRERCQVSRAVTVCNSMWYVPWLHWTVARWIVGEPASYESCNSILKHNAGLADLHPANVFLTANGPIVLDFALTPKHRWSHRPDATHRFQASRDI